MRSLVVKQLTLHKRVTLPLSLIVSTSNTIKSPSFPAWLFSIYPLPKTYLAKDLKTILNAAGPQSGSHVFAPLPCAYSLPAFHTQRRSLKFYIKYDELLKYTCVSHSVVRTLTWLKMAFFVFVLLPLQKYKLQLLGFKEPHRCRPCVDQT